MSKFSRASGILALFVPAVLSGCGWFDYEDREPWRAQVEAACFARKLVKLSPLIQEVDEIEGKGVCGLDRPLKVSALEDGTVRIGGRAVVMSCPMTAALERWVRDSVMPAAYERYGVPVVEIKTFGTYNCRTRNNVPGARLSEHAFANAFDFAGAVLANGYTVTVKRGWRGGDADRAFLRQIHVGACGPFSTVLGPGSDGKHEDHLHLDLARHNAKGTYRYCRPKIDAPPPASYPPTFQVGPDGGVPVAAADPDPWPRTLPEPTPAAAVPLPQASPVPQASTYPPQTAPYPPAPVQQPPGCPPGYVCTPVTPDAVGPAALGWSRGADAVDPGVTGSLGEPYSDE